MVKQGLSSLQTPNSCLHYSVQQSSEHFYLFPLASFFLITAATFTLPSTKECLIPLLSPFSTHRHLLFYINHSFPRRQNPLLSCFSLYHNFMSHIPRIGHWYPSSWNSYSSQQLSLSLCTFNCLYTAISSRNDKPSNNCLLIHLLLACPYDIVKKKFRS